MVEKKTFSSETKASISCIPVRRQVSKFVAFHGWTLIIRKMVERKGFLANLKHQYHGSQWGGHNCSADNKMNGVHYEYPSLLYFTDELWL